MCTVCVDLVVVMFSTLIVYRKLRHTKIALHADRIIACIRTDTVVCSVFSAMFIFQIR